MACRSVCLFACLFSIHGGNFGCNSRIEFSTEGTLALLGWVGNKLIKCKGEGKVHGWDF